MSEVTEPSISLSEYNNAVGSLTDAMVHMVNVAGRDALAVDERKIWFKTLKLYAPEKALELLDPKREGFPYGVTITDIERRVHVMYDAEVSLTGLKGLLRQFTIEQPNYGFLAHLAEHGSAERQGLWYDDRTYILTAQIVDRDAFEMNRNV